MWIIWGELLTPHDSFNSCVQLHDYQRIFLDVVIPFPEGSNGVFRKTAENHTTGGNERPVLEGRDQDAVLLCEQSGSHELSRLRLCSASHDARLCHQLDFNRSMNTCTYT
jgi:hypothetical protein